MKNKNIAFLIWNIDNGGGTERVSLLLADYLAEHGYNVTFFFFCSVGAPFFSYNKKVRIIGFESNNFLMKIFRRLFPDKDLRLHYFIKFYSIDVIIDVDMGQAIHSSIAIKGTKCKEITWDHFNYYENSRFTYRKEGLEACKNSSKKLIVLTKEDKDLYLKNDNFPTDFIEQIYNPITLENDQLISHTKKIVIAVGRLSVQKGFDMLLNIWQQIENLHPDWSLEIYGSGEEQQNLNELIHKFGLERAFLKGRTNDIKSKMKDASIFVLSSRYEGFVLALTEAEAMCLPVVAFNCPTGPSEIVEHKKNGFLIENGDIDTFARYLSLLMNNEDMRNTFGKRSYEISRKLLKDNIFSQWIKLINNL